MGGLEPQDGGESSSSFSSLAAAGGGAGGSSSTARPRTDEAHPPKSWEDTVAKRRKTIDMMMNSPAYLLAVQKGAFIMAPPIPVGLPQHEEGGKTKRAWEDMVQDWKTSWKFV